MAKLLMNIPDTANPRAYIPKELTRDGFIGDVEILTYAFTATLLKPGVSLERIKESLELTLKDIELRMSEADGQ